MACTIQTHRTIQFTFLAPFTGAFLRLKVPMYQENNIESEPNEVSNPFSPDYVSQLKPFRERTKRKPVLEQGLSYQENIATPDPGKRARLLQANI